jgi:hypothetical protein
MPKITQKIQSIRDYPKIGDTHETFRQKADIAWTDLATAIPQMNQFGIEANNLRDEVNNARDATLSYKNAAENAKNAAYGYKVAAENAANKAEAVVIPTEATYSLNDLEVALNGLLTQIVAQQTQIIILKGE